MGLDILLSRWDSRWGNPKSSRQKAHPRRIWSETKNQFLVVSSNLCASWYFFLFNSSVIMWQGRFCLPRAAPLVPLIHLFEVTTALNSRMHLLGSSTTSEQSSSYNVACASLVLKANLILIIWCNSKQREFWYIDEIWILLIAARMIFFPVIFFFLVLMHL